MTESVMKNGRNFRTVFSDFLKEESIRCQTRHTYARPNPISDIAPKNFEGNSQKQF